MALEQSELKTLKPDALGPAEIEAKAETLAVGKASMPATRLFILAMMAGAFIACGATLFLLVQGDTTLSFWGKRIIGGLCFSLGLIMVVCCGAELFTGNSLMVCGLNSGKIDIKGLLRNWGLVWLGNLVGSLIMVGLVFGSDMASMNGGAVGAAMVSVAAGKASLAPATMFFKGILCNFLVCLAVWMSFGARTMVDKIAAVILPVTAFVACGFEHSIANMFFLFMGAAAQSAGFGVDVGTIAASGIALNLVIVTLGNIVGGGIMVALPYWAAYRKKES